MSLQELKARALQNEEVRHEYDSLDEEIVMAGLWRNNEKTPEGKYLVKRRDGTIPEWPSFVIGAKDPAAPEALRAYARKAFDLGMDPEYYSEVMGLAEQFEQYRAEHGNGQPDSGHDVIDDPDTVSEMRSGKSA